MTANGIKAELDGFPVKELTARYGIGRTVLYERINALKIAIEKQGSKGYIRVKALELLDELDAHIKEGGTTPEFVRWNLRGEQQGEQQAETTRIARVQGSEHLSEQPHLPVIFSPTIQVLPPAPDGFDNYRILSEAADQGWVLPTSKLLPLLELRRIPKLNEYGLEKFERRGFVFQRVRRGREGEWRVSRL